MGQLKELLDKNSGYNPDRAIDHDPNYQLINNGDILLANSRMYFRTGAVDMADYIMRFPNRFGLSVGVIFYAEEE
jgi:hypothetical protein